MHPAREGGSLWSVILAGGEGRRMRPLIRRWLGRTRPKQYCTFVGTRSMFQHTVDRADLLTPPDRRVSVVARSHGAEVLQQLEQRHPGRILLQPANCDTAAGVFLGLTYIHAQDPLAIVAIFPSDHFVFPDQPFVGTVLCAAQAVQTWRDRIILLGAAPDRPEPDYGWIQPSDELGWCNGRTVRAVQSFVEKPPIAWARNAMEVGALWNTLVLVARVETLWKFGHHCFPRLMDLFESLRRTIGCEEEDCVLDRIYKQMPAYNFSSQLLARVTSHIGVIELQDVVWSDWGRPERIAGVLDTLGKQPAFPMKCLSAG